MLQKRNAYVEKLEAKKAAMISKSKPTDPSVYEALRSQLEATYNEMKAMLDEKYSAFEVVKRANLQRKLDALAAKIEENKTESGKHQLSDEVLLSVKGLKMYFGGLKAVDDLTFDVKKGEIFGLIGPNGAGKTTVFNCITRFYDATGGDMYFENK